MQLLSSSPSATTTTPNSKSSAAHHHHSFSATLPLLPQLISAQTPLVSTATRRRQRCNSRLFSAADKLLLSADCSYLVCIIISALIVIGRTLKHLLDQKQ